MLNILDVAQSGLKISQVQVENVMNNLANENTPGYKTRNVDVSEAAHIDARITGRGVSVESVSRVTNIYMYQNLVTETSKENALTELDVMLEDIESIFFETDDSGFSADLDRYFQSIENLKTSPDNEIYKNDLANNANILIDTMKTIYEDIENRQANTISTAEDMVEEVNNILKSIGEVSEQIIKSPVEVNDLYDKRDALEKELAQYVDIEISRDINYELKIAGITAIRFDSNVHEIHLVEDYTYQKDIYTEEGTMSTSSLIDKTTWDGTGYDEEEQTIFVQGAVTGPVSFLGTSLGVVAGDSAEDTIDNIITNKATIISTWNGTNPDREIVDIVKDSSDTVRIVYAQSEGDVIPIDATTSGGISFAKSIEDVKGVVDSITYKLNNSVEVSVYYGESITMDWNGDGTATTETVNEDNAIRALVYKINSLSDTKDLITAYNGNYTLDKDGNKVLADTTKDNYLVIEANFPGTENSYDSQIIVTDANAVTGSVQNVVERNSTLSDDAQDNVHLEIYDNPITIDSGMLKPMLDNVNTLSSYNYYEEYKEQLDIFAQKLADLSNGFIENGDGDFVWGEDASTLSADYDQMVSIGLFSGSDVKTLTFNTNMINQLDQQKLDYLADLQWKDDIDFDGTGDNLTSFSKFYQEIRVDIADDRENIIFKKESQTAVRESLELTYDKLTKVDSDEQMIELIKFQSAYEANAKMITIVDEMLQTLLGIVK